MSAAVFTALIIQDDPAQGDIHDALVAIGCSGIETLSRDGALQLANEQPKLPDVIVLGEPDMRLLQRLVALNVPIITVCPEREIDTAFLAGAVDCITLPIRGRELEGRLRRALRQRLESKHRLSRERLKSEKIKALTADKGQLEELVAVDPLTTVASRRHSMEVLEKECRRAARINDEIAVIMIDLDYFHAYNETYGHVAGDQCLRQVAQAMSKCLRRSSDLIGRYGGEEFVVVLPGLSAADAQQVAETIRAQVQQLAIKHAGSRAASVVTVTAGFTSLRVTHDTPPSRLIQAADAALLRAKADGRNRIEGAVRGDAPVCARGTDTALPVVPITARQLPRER